MISAVPRARFLSHRSLFAAPSLALVAQRVPVTADDKESDANPNQANVHEMSRSAVLPVGMLL